MDEATKIWDWGYTLDAIPVLMKAAIVTVEATFISFFFAAILGLVLALLRMAGGVVGWITSAIVETIRSTPLLIQIFFIFFVLPRYGVSLDAFTAGIIALSLHYGCYCSEVYRAGLEAVPRGQWEACVALNLNSWNTFKNIILPQAIPPIVPALGNYLVALFKDTPLLSAIAVLELVQTAKILGSENFRYTEPMTIVGLTFLVLSLVSSAGIRWVERRLNVRSVR
jgi:polar amino acid transport system permease protein